MNFAGNSYNLIGQVTQTLNSGDPVPLQFPGTAASPQTPMRPHHAIIQVEGNAVRWGTLPSPSEGQFVSNAPPFNIIYFDDPTTDYAGLLQQIQFCAIGGVATLQIIYLT